jgi:hypothetical protein
MGGGGGIGGAGGIGGRFFDKKLFVRPIHVVFINPSVKKQELIFKTHCKR